MVWFGLDKWFEQKDKINGFWYALVEFGLVCLIEFGLVCLFHKQTNNLNNNLILINLICEFVYGYSTDKQTNKIIIYFYFI